MRVVPLVSVPSQTLAVQLGAQPCQLNVYQKSTGLYVDIFVNGAAILTGALALNLVKLVRDAYLGFVGDLAFFDTQGSDDPMSTSLGSRFVLLWLEDGDPPVAQ